MKQEFKTHEFFYYTDSARGNGETDFMGGNAVFNNEERLDFLKAYSYAASRWNNDPMLATKVATIEEASEAVKVFSDPEHVIRRRIPLTALEAYSADKQNQYKNLILYAGARVEKDEVFLEDGDISPVSCARFLFDTPKKAVKVAFDLFMNADYEGLDKTPISAGSAGRCIDIRIGTLDVVKLKAYFTGAVCIAKTDLWDGPHTQIGEVKFGEYNHFEIEITDTVSVTVNGAKTENHDRRFSGDMDSLFFDGGLHPRGTWKIKNMMIDDQPFVYKAEEPKDETLVPLGTVNLPYVIGTKENRDKRLYFKKTFTYEKDGRIAELEVDTLDPCGKVWLNGELVLDAKDVMKHVVPVTDVLKDGENELCIMVEPRAPENYYYWHRHKDLYNGWFCGEVWLNVHEKAAMETMVIRTLDATGPISAEAEITFSEKVSGQVKVLVAPWYPQKGAEVEVAAVGVNGKTALIPFSGEWTAWSPDTPVLYSVRAVFCDNAGNEKDDLVEEYGFRTIAQENGAFILNGKRVLMNGALIMQYLPPVEQIPCNHNCPTIEQIAWQFMMIRRMNGNTARLHMLGYGSNSRLIAKTADYLGVMLIWVTRMIDSLESMVFSTEWQEGPYYQQQMREVINHPSIICWEGSNEFFASLSSLDRMYDVFVKAAREVDSTRLLCPCSYLYYENCAYYTDDGKYDNHGRPANASFGWKDPLVIRSAHTYWMLGGYHFPWNEIREQRWPEQKNMLASKDHGYIVSEFAITGLQNHTTPEAMEKNYSESYERWSEEYTVGHTFDRAEWRASQGHQGFTAFHAVKKMRMLDADGMTWCCLTGGANHSAYLKPPIDFYGYAKLGFYSLKEGYQKLLPCNGNVDTILGNEDFIEPTLVNNSIEAVAKMKVEVFDQKGNLVDSREYDHVELKANQAATRVQGFKPALPEAGYYTVVMTAEADV